VDITYSIGTLSLANPEEKEEFIQQLTLRKRSLIPRLQVVVDLQRYIVDKVESLERLNIENKLLDWQKKEETFSGISMERFRYYFSPALDI
jgi:hypothetical protein